MGESPRHRASILPSRSAAYRRREPAAQAAHALLPDELGRRGRRAEACMPPDELGRYDQRAEAAARVHAPTPCSARPAPHALPPDELGRVAQSESHTDCAIGNLIFVSFDNLDHDRRWAPF